MSKPSLIHIGSLSHDTRMALAGYSDRNDYGDWLAERAWLESHWFAWLIVLLEYEEDSPELFPRGKWATIQRLQTIMRDAMTEHAPKATQP